MRCLYFREGMEQWIEIEMEVSGSGSGSVAQWIRHLTTNQGITGSNPARDNKSFVNIPFFSVINL